MKKISLILSVIFSAVLFVSCSNSKADTPSAAAEAYYNAMKDGNFEKALSYSLLEDEKDIQMVVSGLNELKKGGFEIKDFKILSEEISEDGENAHVKVEVTTIQKQGQESQTETDNMPVTKVNGIWRVGL